MKYPGISTKDKTDILEQYGHLIHETNSRFNLTGLKTIEDITNTLIISSLIPFSAINVPRGTLIADIGTGAGIPGIPLSILIKSATFTLFDATNKKIEFITDVITKLGIDNARAINGRIEELGRDELYRETFDWVVTRAMAEPFMATELGAPLLKTGGYLYLYASEKQVGFHDRFLKHVSELGLVELSDAERESVLNISCDGMLFRKIRGIDIKFPRRINAIKRDIDHTCK